MFIFLAQNNKLECPEELANYIQTRRMIRRKRNYILFP